MNLEDNWCQCAIDVIKDVDANILVTKLNKYYSYDECKNYNLIASCTTGTDHIDNREIPPVSLKGETDFLSGIYATAEMTWSLILSLIRKVPFAFEDVKRGNWNREAWQGTELHGKTLGIVGCGRVGQQVANIAKVFGMKVLHCDKPGTAKDSHGLKMVLQNSDIITVHTSLNGTSKGLLGSNEFLQMKPTAYFVNTSRGQVVDEEALLWALNNKKIAGAALDVVCNEPSINPKLVKYAKNNSNLILTPHLGGNTAESRETTQVFIARKIVDHINAEGV